MSPLHTLSCLAVSQHSDCQGEKYLVVNLAELVTNQIAIIYLLENKIKIVNILPNIYGIIKKYYNTLSRILITSVLFFVLSYPARKYWVYKNTSDNTPPDTEEEKQD